MFNDLYYRFGPPEWRVEPDLRTVLSLIFREHRQVDVAILAANALRPEIAGECKRYGRSLNVKDIEGFLGMLEDLGAKHGVLVAPRGFSPAAQRSARGTTLQLLQFRIGRTEWPARTCRSGPACNLESRETNTVKEYDTRARYAHPCPALVWRIR